MPMRVPSHRGRGQLDASQRRAGNDARRGTAASRGYDADWRRFRTAILAGSPACVACGSMERLNVDHIASVRDAPERRLDPSNVRVLCQSCHSARTSRDHSWNPRV